MNPLDLLNNKLSLAPMLPVGLTESGLFLNGSNAIVAVVALAIAVMFTIGWLAPDRQMEEAESRWVNFLLAGTFWFLSFMITFDIASQGLIRLSLTNPSGWGQLFILGAILTRGVFCAFGLLFVVYALYLVFKGRQ